MHTKFKLNYFFGEFCVDDWPWLSLLGRIFLSRVCLKDLVDTFSEPSSPADSACGYRK